MSTKKYQRCKHCGEERKQCANCSWSKTVQMGSFNSKAASKQHPTPVYMSNKNVKTNEQREDGESITNIKKCDEDECEVSQNVQDLCTKKKRTISTSSPKRSANLPAVSYLWLVSSPITEEEDKSAVKCRSPGRNILISPSRTDHCQSSKQESMKATRSRPQFYSYLTNTRTKTQSIDGENPSCPAGTAPFSAAKTVRGRKSTFKSNASAMILTRSVGFGVDKPYSYPVQRY